MLELPYQFVLKLMTLAASPVGIDEERRGDAIPRQLYDLDILIASFTNSSQWEAMVAYCSVRYARECETWTIDRHRRGRAQRRDSRPSTAMGLVQRQLI